MRTDVTCDWRLFEKLAPETGKARLYGGEVERRGDTASWLEGGGRIVSAGMARQWHGWSMTTDTLMHCHSQLGRSLRRSWTGCAPGHEASGGWRARLYSQYSVGLICSYRRIPKMSRAAAFCTDWTRRIKLAGKWQPSQRRSNQVGWELKRNDQRLENSSQYQPPNIAQLKQRIETTRLDNLINKRILNHYCIVLSSLVESWTLWVHSS